MEHENLDGIDCNNQPAAPSSRQGGPFAVQFADTSLLFRTVELDDATPTGRQLAKAAGFHDTNSVVVLQVLADGQLENIRPDEIADLAGKSNRFVIAESDRTYYFVIDDTKFEWPCGIISGAVLRKVAAVPAEKALYFERRDEPDQLVKDADLLDLEKSGIEHFYSRKQVWELNVQGVKIISESSAISVRDAMTEAGFDVTQGWHIFLKYAGQPKQQVELTTIIDLTKPGIEKVRLTPKDVSNGEAKCAMQRDFKLLEVDEEFLTNLCFAWETLIEEKRRWLLIHDYPVPQGYTVSTVKLALEIPETYPGAQIDMFYSFPPMVLTSKREIDRTQVRATIRCAEYHGWSRHRGEASKWNPATDNVVTHLA